MKLSDIKRNPDAFLKEVEAARERLTLGSVSINHGIRSAADIEAILDNPVTDTVDWRPYYDAATKFD